MDTPVSARLAVVDDFVNAMGELLEAHDRQLEETLHLVQDNDEVREALQRRINRE
jgi:hypothetical protein